MGEEKVSIGKPLGPFRHTFEVSCSMSNTENKINLKLSHLVPLGGYFLVFRQM